MTAHDSGLVLLALDAGVRETGWAVFKHGAVAASGVTGLSTRRKLEAEVRVSHLIDSLDVLADEWSPQVMALCQPSGINWPVPALDLLVLSLATWSSERRLPHFSYTEDTIEDVFWRWQWLGIGPPKVPIDPLPFCTECDHELESRSTETGPGGYDYRLYCLRCHAFYSQPQSSDYNVQEVIKEIERRGRRLDEGESIS